MILENAHLRIELDETFGTVRSIVDKAVPYELIIEPRRAGNFRLLLPLAERDDNYIVGREQRLSGIERSGDIVTLRWDGPLVNEAGTYPVDVKMTIRLHGEAIEFGLCAQNRSEHSLAEVWYPILGGMHGLGPPEVRRDTTVIVGRAILDELPLFRRFGAVNELGPPEPELLFSYPGDLSMAWCDVYNVLIDRGWYFASHDAIARFKVLRFCLYPGMGRGRPDDDWPRADEVGDDTPVGVIMHWSHFPHTPPGGSFDGSTVILRRHAGGWRTAATHYRDWFVNAFPPCNPETSWMHREMTSFQNTMFLTPEGRVNCRFCEIGAWAQGALDYGVRHLLISGWNVGGHDRGYPAYQPDPRLGTWEDLARGVQTCHEMGMRVFFFANIHPVDTTTEWYRRELHRYMARTPHGRPYGPRGWGMGTVGARWGFSAIPHEWASTSISEYRALIVGAMRRIAEIGADGIHIDKCMPSPMDFNPQAQASPDRADLEGTLQCLEEILDACRAVNPQFCLSLESFWDRTLPYSDVTWWAFHDHVSLLKAVFPQWIVTQSVNQPYAYNIVNQHIRQGFAMLVGPAHYAASMAHPLWAPLSAYIRETERIRSELREVIFFGEILEGDAVLIEGDFASWPHARWTVFREPRTGRRAAVLANLGGVDSLVRWVGFLGREQGRIEIHQPYAEIRQAQAPCSMTVPPERFLVVVEL